MVMKRLAAPIAAVFVAISAAAAASAEVEIQMLNKGAAGAMVFEPALVSILPGDSVRFLPTDKGHDAVSIPKMMPEGAQAFAGKMNQEVAVTFDLPGVYGVKCKPHYGMGMVALIVVGTPDNVDSAKEVKHPGKAKKVFAALFEELNKTLASR